MMRQAVAEIGHGNEKAEQIQTTKHIQATP
jgi:hypothetical protein